MNDEDVARQIARFRVVGPPPSLKKQVMKRVERQRIRRCFVAGCYTAVMVGASAAGGAWLSAQAEGRRLAELKHDVRLVEVVTTASELFGDADVDDIVIPHAMALRDAPPAARRGDGSMR